MTEARGLTVERSGAIALLTLNRPKAANALDSALHEALVEALQHASIDITVGAIVLSAAGERAFSAGADLREFSDSNADLTKRIRRKLLLRTLLAFVDADKPLVVAIRGKAIGAGAMLAFLGDVVVAGDGARFAFPEISLAMPSPMGISVVVARGGRLAAQRLVQLGEEIDANEAARLGLVDAVITPEGLLDCAIARATLLAAHAGPAYAANKRWMNRLLRSDIENAAAAAEDQQDATRAMGAPDAD
jgi:enoyl-CoA hydratase/carnithine racemase